MIHQYNLKIFQAYLFFTIQKLLTFTCSFSESIKPQLQKLFPWPVFWVFCCCLQIERANYLPHTYLPTPYLPTYLILTYLPHTYLLTSYLPTNLPPTYLLTPTYSPATCLLSTQVPTYHHHYHFRTFYLKIVEVRQRQVQEQCDGQEEEAEGATDGANGSEVAMESFQIKGELAPTNLK